jgi:hypothetical protein
MERRKFSREFKIEAVAPRDCEAESGARHPKKAAAYFTRDSI